MNRKIYSFVFIFMLFVVGFIVLRRPRSVDPLKVKMAKTNLHGSGFGMIATNSIKKGELIEQCPLLVEKEKKINGILADYYFAMGNGDGVFPLGYGGIYNHSFSPNAEFKEINADKRVMNLRALEPIRSGDEITINYGPNNWDRRGIEPN